jgi:PAS domain S-box-containing protein
MATSADYLRLATSSSRPLAETALDSLPDAVVVVDTHHKHFPVVLANATAHRCLTPQSESVDLLESPLARWLAASSASTLEATLALSDPPLPTSRVLAWRFVEGEISVMTDIKPLESAAGQRLVMLTFAPAGAEFGLVGAIENLPFDLLILDTGLKVTYANAGAERSSGSAPGGLVGASALELTPTATLHPDVYTRALHGSHFHDDGVEVAVPARPTRSFEVDVRPLKGASGIVGLVVLSIEVTERRSQTHSHNSGDLRWLALTEHARDIITVASADGILQYVSGGVRNSLGYTSEERESNDLFEGVHPDDYEGLRTKYRQLVDGEIKAYSREFRVRHKDGSYRWLESSYARALDNPLIGGVVINSRDITERKLAESRLAQREEIFRLAADAVDGIIYEWDVARGLVHRSRGVLEVLGLEPEDLEPSIEAWRERIHPRDFEAAKKAINLGLLDGRGWTTTYRIRDVRGRYRSILERGVIQRNASGDPVRAIGCCVDVTEIKRVTDLLTETQRAAQIGGWEYNYATRELTWTEEIYRIYETTPAEFSVTWDAMLAQCTAESLQRFRDACEQSKSAGIDLELEITTLKNQRIWIRLIGHQELLDGRPVRAFGSVQNVHAQKVAQMALERSEELLRATTANAADMLVLVDTELRVRFINKTVGGMSIEQIIGREIGVLLPESARAHVLDKLRQILGTGETATYEFESNEAGQRQYFENRAVLVRDAGIGTGISISTRDITERKRLEQEILDVSGRERQSIGRDLHDGLGQELTGVALMLRGLAGRVQPGCPEAVESINEIVELVNRSIENARSLARGLLPVRAETGGLASALQELAARSRDLYGLEVNFRAEGWPEPNLDETDASHLYRIAQEALTNAARHGHATLVDIFLHAAGRTFLLCITDNGEGIQMPSSPYTGMGLKIMKYRAGMIGANFEIAPDAPRGTVVRVTGELADGQCTQGTSH